MFNLGTLFILFVFLWIITIEYRVVKINKRINEKRKRGKLCDEIKELKNKATKKG